MQPDAFLSRIPDDRTSLTDDERIANVVPLPPPESLIRFFPVQGTPAEGLVARTRENLRQILLRRSDRLLVVIGPCSIHDPLAAIDYAQRLTAVRERLADELEIVMRKGKPVSVIIPIKYYEELLERVEDAGDVAALKRARSKPLHFRPLEDYLAERKRK